MTLALLAGAGCAEQSSERPAGAPTAPDVAAPPPNHPPAVSWLRARHPELPITFDVPARTAVQEARDFPLGRARRKDGRRQPVRLFGVRPVGGPGYHALEIAFFWITDATRGTHAGELESLASDVSSFAPVRRFLERVLYERTPDVELEDAGGEVVAGLPAHSLEVAATIARGTRDERLTRGRVVVVPVPPGAALIVVARFDSAAVEWERDELLGRILGSIAIGVDEPPAAV